MWKVLEKCNISLKMSLFYFYMNLNNAEKPIALKTKHKSKKEQNISLIKPITKWYKDDLFYYLPTFLHTPDIYAEEKLHNLLQSKKLYILQSRKFTQLFNMFSNRLRH